MKYGAITTADSELLERIMAKYRNCSMRFLEIGVWKGETAQGVERFCRDNKIALEYWGIDIVPITIQLQCNSKFITGLSCEVYPQIPNCFDVILVDGCHCLTHVILDIILYAPKVYQHGFMMFHDTAPHLQHIQKNPFIHDGNNPLWNTAVCDALEMVDWPNGQWELHSESCDSQSDIGGIKAFRKLWGNPKHA